MAESLGLLFIGDPHLSGRPPGFRKDDYPRRTLDKLSWSISYAKSNRLLPILLGDLFHYPRDNANWLLVELMQLLDPSELGEPVLAVAGNHDCRENNLSADDTLAVLAAAGRVRILECDRPWIGVINGVTVMVGGSCWGQSLPKAIERQTKLVFWVTHHDLRFPGYEDSARMSCVEIPGVDAVINGHIHRHLVDVTAGATVWCNPGNVSRVTRGDANRLHRPAALRVDISAAGWTRQRIEIPHAPFDEVFHSELIGEDESHGTLPEFIKGLKTLQQTRTSDGAGLREFLEFNLCDVDPPIAAAIRELSETVLAEKSNGR